MPIVLIAACLLGTGITEEIFFDAVPHLKNSSNNIHLNKVTNGQWSSWVAKDTANH